MVGQVDDLVGVAGQRRGVAGDEVLARAHAQHQRAAEPGDDQHARASRGRAIGQAVGAVQLRQRRLHRRNQRRVPVVTVGRIAVGQSPLDELPWDGVVRLLALQATGDQVGDDLGVGGRLELVALLLQPLLERLESSRSRRCGRRPPRRRRPSADGH